MGFRFKIHILTHACHFEQRAKLLLAPAAPGLRCAAERIHKAVRGIGKLCVAVRDVPNLLDQLTFIMLAPGLHFGDLPFELIQCLAHWGDHGFHTGLPFFLLHLQDFTCPFDKRFRRTVQQFGHQDLEVLFDLPAHILKLAQFFLMPSPFAFQRGTKPSDFRTLCGYRLRRLVQSRLQFTLLSPYARRADRPSRAQP